MSPGCTLDMSNGASVSSVMRGRPYEVGVAPARTNSHRGVITPTPNDRWLGFTRWTVMLCAPSSRYRSDAAPRSSQTSTDVERLANHQVDDVQSIEQSLRERAGGDSIAERHCGS